MPESPSTEASSSSLPIVSDADLEKLLNREASALNRELEVDRILKAFKLNPYEILDIDESASAEAIKKKYRQLSLFIHPDKTSHARAPDAFDLLKKAESELSETARREELDAVIKEARIQLLKSLSLPSSVKDDDPRLKTVKPPFKTQLRAKAKEMLIEEEVRRRKAIKLNLANEGLEAKKKEDEIEARKRKADNDKVWEENREQRVGSWRDFQGNKKKKQKTKVTLLG
ncbi:DnaJ-domain-containing protein [Rickenella mellea]|uniref:DnaJ-domain-containing protein n=1 Tax=Rickenella mellea TaxID=50990 RepID=A0A4Y7QFZ6_9AGAM|nr:DnaJ-domain-containing protein [Rickenella mellea]